MGRESRRRKALARLEQQQLDPNEIPSPLGQRGPINGARASNGVTVSRTQVATSFYSGPLPHPELLKQYDEVVPGSAAIILGQFQKQGDHRMDLEKLAVSSEIKRANYGLIAAAFVSLAILVAGARLIHEGHDAAGATVVGIDMVGVITAFLVGGGKRRKEREQKAQVQAQLARR